MPTLTRTWTSSQNNACADQTSHEAQVKEILLDMKTKMLAAGWTVTQSSDSVTYDTSDNWSATSDIVRNSDGSAHSWVVLRSPANWPSSGEYIYFGIDWNVSSGDDHKANFSSRGDADWTGLSTTIGPAHSTKLANTNTTGSYNYGAVVTSTLANCKFHSSYSSTGDFIYYVSNSTTQHVNFLLILNKLSNTDSADLYPIAHYCYGSGSTNSGLTYSMTYYNYLRDDNHSKIFHFSTGVGSGSALNGGSIADTSGGNSTWWNHLASGTAGDDISGKMPLTTLQLAGSYPSGSKGLRGNLTDIYGGSYNQSPYSKYTVGDVSPGTGTIVLGCIGGLWVPCSVAPDFS